MYESFSGSRNSPFSLTPNTHFTSIRNPSTGIELLLVALRNQEGFIKISGEVGTGKTLLCRMLLNALEAPFLTAYIPNPGPTPMGLYLAVAEELGVVSEEIGAVIIC